MYDLNVIEKISYECNICGEEFNHRGSCEDHISDTHNTVCINCDRECSLLSENTICCIDNNVTYSLTCNTCKASHPDSKNERIKISLRKRTIIERFCNYYDIGLPIEGNYMSSNGELAFIPVTNYKLLDNFKKIPSFDVLSITTDRTKFYKLKTVNKDILYDKVKIDEIFALLCEPLDKDKIKISINVIKDDIGPCLISVEGGIIMLAPMELNA